MHLGMWQGMRDELEKIARMVGGKFVPDLVEGLLKKAPRGKMPSMLQHTPGKSTNEMAEWMAKYTPGYRARAAAGAGPEMSQKAIERLGVGSLPVNKAGRHFKPPTSEQATKSVENVRRIGGINRELTEKIQISNRGREAAMKTGRGPLGLRTAREPQSITAVGATPAKSGIRPRKQMATGVASPAALRRPQMATGVASPQALQAVG